MEKVTSNHAFESLFQKDNLTPNRSLFHYAQENNDLKTAGNVTSTKKII